MQIKTFRIIKSSSPHVLAWQLLWDGDGKLLSLITKRLSAMLLKNLLYDHFHKELV